MIVIHHVNFWLVGLPVLLGFLLGLSLISDIVRRDLVSVLWSRVQFPVRDLERLAVPREHDFAFHLVVVHDAAFEVVVVLCCVDWLVLQALGQGSEGPLVVFMVPFESPHVFRVCLVVVGNNTVLDWTSITNMHV